MKRRKALLALLSSSLLVLPGLVHAQRTPLILIRPTAATGMGESTGRSGTVSPRIVLNQNGNLGRPAPVQAALGQAKRAARRAANPAFAGAGTSGPRLAGMKIKASNLTVADVGTGSGDINEVEPNDTIAQDVDMPVNIFGAINPSGDVDGFDFPAFAGEQINIEAFASRIPNSLLIADIGLFDASGNLLQEQVGDGINDPLIQYVVPADGIYVAAITDADGFGGSNFVYILNVEGGIDFQEGEPNDSIPNPIPVLPATIFGSISSTSDVDFFSFSAVAGTTLIADVDAAVFGSNLNAEINLTDPFNGIQYFYNDQFDGDDPRFNIVLPYTGTYVVGIDATNGATTGGYRLNLSLVPGNSAPNISSVTILGKKHIEVAGTGFNHGGAVNVNGADVPTAKVDKRHLRGKVKGKTGQVVTISRSQDGRRSNPLIIQ